MPERTNEQWIADLQSEGERQTAAIADLKERLRRGIYYYLSRERSDLADLSLGELEQMAEDMAQDAILRVLANLDSFRGDSLFTTWATRIAVRVAISDLRRARYKDFSLDDLTANGDFLSASANPVAGDKPPAPERAAEQTDVLGLLERTLKEALTERQYRALMAVAVQDVPLEIVAEQMGTNRNALYKLIHDARRKLRTVIEQQGLSMEYILDLFQD
ncbi:MAG: RNA polymerase sigma factor [Candidatus Flexifilum sp.]|jgi:RNA polymerase sigma-70 factor (ECF subfamily)